MALVGGCATAQDGDGDDAAQVASGVTSAAVKTVQSYVTTTCSTAAVIGLSKQIADEVSCLNPTALTRFAAGSGITITSNAVLPYLAANAKADLQKVGSVQINSAFRTVAQQYLLLQWFDRGRCGITAAAAVGNSNHESGRAVDVQNYSSRISAMAAHHWSHDVAGDPVHFDHLTSTDIRGKDTLAFQRLWNRNHPSDKISEDGDYGPQTEARLKQSPATGFAKGASCTTAKLQTGDVGANADTVSVDGPDRVAPGATAHYTITLANTGTVDWPAGTQLQAADLTADGTPGAPGSALYDAATWASTTTIGTLAAAIPAGGQGTVAIDIVAPSVTSVTAVNTQVTLSDSGTALGSVVLAVTVTPDGDDNLSGDSDDQGDTEGGSSGGCAAGASNAGWLMLAPLALVLRRRRRHAI